MPQRVTSVTRALVNKCILFTLAALVAGSRLAMSYRIFMVSSPQILQRPATYLPLVIPFPRQAGVSSILAQALLISLRPCCASVSPQGYCKTFELVSKQKF